MLRSQQYLLVLLLDLLQPLVPHLLQLLVPLLMLSFLFGSDLQDHVLDRPHVHILLRTTTAFNTKVLVLVSVSLTMILMIFINATVIIDEDHLVIGVVELRFDIFYQLLLFGSRHGHHILHQVVGLRYGTPTQLILL